MPRAHPRTAETSGICETSEVSGRALNRVLVVGNTGRREFREARAAIRAQRPTIDAPGIDAACAILAGEDPFDLIVVAEDHPGQYSDEAIDRLRRLAPLARVVGLLGSWCEGESRTGRPWPGAIRVYWHQWLPRFGRESARLDAGALGSWSLPVTASDEERMLALADEPFSKRTGRIAVCSSEFAMQDWLCAGCRRAGYSAVWLRGSGPHALENAAAGIFDAADSSDSQYEALRRLADDLRPAPVLALLGFPRVEDRDRALAAGAAAVLSKPLLLEDLFWQLDRLVLAERSDEVKDER